MKTSSFFLFFIVASIAIAVVKAGSDDHDHESCACAAKEEGFAIDCSNQGAMTTALAALASNDCASSCSSEICHRNYLIIQSHHDYCLESELPPTLEDALHQYEDNCDECEISKKYDPSLPDCTGEASCSDTSGSDAYTAMTAAGCAADCSSNECKANFHILKVVHDTCEEDVLSTVAETNYHDIEEACVEDHGCNIKSSPDGDTDTNPLVCDETDTSGGSTTTMTLLSFVGAFMVGATTMMF